MLKNCITELHVYNKVRCLLAVGVWDCASVRLKEKCMQPCPALRCFGTLALEGNSIQSIGNMPTNMQPSGTDVLLKPSHCRFAGDQRLQVLRLEEGRAYVRSAEGDHPQHHVK